MKRCIDGRDYKLVDIESRIFTGARFVSGVDSVPEIVTDNMIINSPEDLVSAGIIKSCTATKFYNPIRTTITIGKGLISNSSTGVPTKEKYTHLYLDDNKLSYNTTSGLFGFKVRVFKGTDEFNELQDLLKSKKGVANFIDKLILAHAPIVEVRELINDTRILYHIRGVNTEKKRLRNKLDL